MGADPIEAFLDLVRRRRSTRRYRPDPVPEELLEQVLEAGRWAPSAVNSQPWEFVVVRALRVKQALYDLAGVAGLKWKHLLTAPVVIVIAARKVTPYSRDDCIFAAQNMMLCATDLGLATCYVGGFAEAAIRKLLSLPEGYLVPGMITLGYAEEEPAVPSRRELAGMVHSDTYQGRGLDLSHVGRIGRIIVKLLRLQGSKK